MFYKTPHITAAYLSLRVPGDAGLGWYMLQEAENAGYEVKNL